MGPYEIKVGYVERFEAPEYFVDEYREVCGNVSQPLVYKQARSIARGAEIGKIVDVGCGRAEKWAEIAAETPEIEYVGIDYGPNIAWCRRHYRWGTWLDVDLEEITDLDAVGALVVVADVIEHLRDPFPLLGALRRSGTEAVLLTTPERDLTWGEEHNGPPPNPCHVREWNLSEFQAFLVRHGFEILAASLTRSSNIDYEYATILVVAQPARGTR